MTGKDLPAALPDLSPKPAGSLTFNANVQGARGLLVLMVFVFHIASSGLPGFSVLGGTQAVNPALRSLQFAVEIFFCISGYVIVGAIQRTGNVKKFLFDRAVRILPVLWLTLAIIIPLGILTQQPLYTGMPLQKLAWVIPANLFLLPGTLPLPLLHMAAWSLSYEALFYVIAVSLWAIPREQRLRRLGVIALAIALIVWHPRAIFFAVGALVALVDLRRHRVLALASAWPELGLIVFFITWYIVQFGRNTPEGWQLFTWAANGSIVWAVVATGAALCAWTGIVNGNGMIGHLLRSRAFQWLGMVSYSFYLWHLIVLAVAKRVMSSAGLLPVTGQWSQAVLLVLTLPVCFAVSYGSFLLVEQKLARWLKSRVRARS